MFGVDTVMPLFHVRLNSEMLPWTRFSARTRALDVASPPLLHHPVLPELPRVLHKYVSMRESLARESLASDSVWEIAPEMACASQSVIEMLRAAGLPPQLALAASILTASILTASCFLSASCLAASSLAASILASSILAASCFLSDSCLAAACYAASCLATVCLAAATAVCNLTPRLLAFHLPS